MKSKCPLWAASSGGSASLVTLVCCSALSTLPSLAGNVWTPVNQNWNDTANWAGAFPTGNATINTATGNFAVISGTPSFTPVDILVGVAAAGRVDQTAGTLNTGNGNWMVIGRNASGSGIFNLADTSGTGGTLTGFAQGTGSINVGGTSTTSGRLILGDTGNSTGTFNMNTTGTLKLENDQFGLLLGNGGTSTGNFNLDGGTLQVNSLGTDISLLIGTNGGDGNFRMSNGTVNATGGIWIGDNAAGSQGVLEISGGTFSATATSAINTTANGQHFIGRGLGQGSATISGTASVTLAGVTHVGYSNTATAGTTGLLKVDGGSLTTNGEVRIGSAQNANAVIAAATGNLNVTGGTATINGNLVLARGNDAGDVVNGTATVSGTGTLNVRDDLVVGYAGNANTGTFNMTGGVVNVGTAATRWMIVGQYDSTKGIVNISGGALNLQNGSALRFSTGNNSATNVITQSGGSVNFYSDAGVTLGGAGVLDMQQGGVAATNNTYNLNGGTLNVPQIMSQLNTGNRTFNFNGGTLKATGNNAAFMNLGTGNARANVRDGGAFIHSNGYDVTIAQSLLHSNVGGDLATDGGLTKQGGGTLVLTGNNTYSGITTVSGGRLIVNGTHTGGGTYTVAANTTLGGTGSIGTSAINVTGTLAPGASVQTFASGTVSFANGSTFAAELDSSVSTASAADLQIISGDLNLTGTVDLSLVDLAASPLAFADGTIFALINYSGSWNGGLFTFGGNSIADDGTFTAGLNTWKLDYNSAEGGLNFTGEYLGAGDSFVTLTAVPEPNVAMLVGSVGTLILLRRRKQR